jgi:hypothetical protein
LHASIDTTNTAVMHPLGGARPQSVLQASSSKANGAGESATSAEAGAPEAQAKAGEAEQSASSPSSESQGWLLRLAKASKNFLSLD